MNEEERERAFNHRYMTGNWGLYYVRTLIKILYLYTFYSLSLSLSLSSCVLG